MPAADGPIQTGRRGIPHPRAGGGVIPDASGTAAGRYPPIVT